MIGQNFGPYEIVAKLGEGGMGEVYRARDTRLGREVAIKTLPASFSRDPARLHRFEVEARAASLLSHPNIVAVYDIGTADGQPYIVSELLEGETLRDRLTRGPIPLRKSIEFAVAIADALAAAHARGIVHRDLKPENLFLTRDGRLKILDFGIAKLTDPEPAAGATAAATVQLTEAGTAVGTPGYMSPEQVRGESTDHRSDIFALGAVLHEMLSGVAVFQRGSRIGTMNAVLESNPPELPGTVPPAVSRIVERCLEKAADSRFQSARDLAFALNGLSDVSMSATGARPVVIGPRKFDSRIAAAALTAAAITAAGMWMLPNRVTNTSPGVRRFTISAIPGRSHGYLAISPDGTRVVQSIGDPTANESRLAMRTLDQLEMRELPGTEGASHPFFSPDGNWVAFRARDKLKKVALAGGLPVTICDIRVMLGGSWGPGGDIIIAQREQGLSIVSAEGGVLRALTSPDKSSGEIDHHAPHFLPDGKSFVFTIHAGFEIFRVAVRSLETGQQRTLIDDGFDGRGVASGHLVYGREDRLYAVPFDSTSSTINGQPVDVAEGVSTFPEDGTADFAVASDGTLVYVPAEPPPNRSLVWVDRSGRAEPLPAPVRAYDHPVLSPDGKRVAVDVADGPRTDIWIYEVGTESLTRVTSDGLSSNPLWSGDGKRLAYAARRNAERHIVWQPVDGSAAPVSLVSSRNNVWPAAWQGNQLVFVEDPPTSLTDIKLLDVTQPAKVSNLVDGPLAEMMPSVSPDGRWLAYMVFERRPQVHVRPFTGGATRQITTDGGGQPRWSADGRELFYRRLDQFMRVTFQAAPELTIGKAESLFKDPYPTARWGSPKYDVARDGQRFLFLRDEGQPPAMPAAVIVENWFAELNRRVPTRR